METEYDSKGIELKTLLYRLRYQGSRGKIVAIWGKRILRKIWQEKPVPLPIVFLLSKLVADSSQVHGLRTRADFPIRRGAELNNPQLANILKNEVLGNWSLNVETINYLENDIKFLRPKIILEFGSGISTLCLAHLLDEIHGNDPSVRVYSVEQNKEFANESERLIGNHGYDKYVKIIHAPLTNVRIEGVSCYSYDLQRLGDVLAGARPDYCLIDGPSVTQFDGRFATLPLVRRYLAEKAQFRLDDALRDRELLVARKWQQLPYIHIYGVVLAGKGMLSGFVGA